MEISVHLDDVLKLGPISALNLYNNGKGFDLHIGPAQLNIVSCDDDKLKINGVRFTE